MQVELLQKIMKEERVSKQMAAKALGINRESLRQRLKGATEFTLREIELISELLSLNEKQIRLIFFEEKVS